MEAADRLLLVLGWMPEHALLDHVRALSAQPMTAVVEYPSPGGYISTSCAVALHYAKCLIAVMRSRAHSVLRTEIAAELREAAAHEPRNHDGIVNLSSWLACDGTAWHTVFSYSSPEPGAPWFCSLDVESQRLILLLVAEDLETQWT